jgi:hypothetical protein
MWVGNFVGWHSGEEGANAPPCQHAVPASVTTDGERQVRHFVATNRHARARLRMDTARCKHPGGILSLCSIACIIVWVIVWVRRPFVYGPPAPPGLE